MKLVSYNIQYGLGKDNRYDLARISHEIEDADVVALQEVERHWQRSGNTDQPAIIGSHLPEHHWVYGANLDMDASFRDSSGRLVNRRRQFGTMILSRSPIISSRNHLLPKYGTLTQHSIQQGYVADILCAYHRKWELAFHLAGDHRRVEVDFPCDLTRARELYRQQRQTAKKTG